VTARKDASHLVKKTQPLALVLFGLTVLIVGLWPMPAWAQYDESILYNFCQVTHCTDGDNPGFGTLIFDSQGNLYGTTLYGGTANGNGVVYKLTPPPGGSGAWTETVIYEFCQLSGCADGSAPYSGLVFDSSGNLYGTTQQGGSSRSDGVIYKLTPPPGGSGAWTETVIHTFCEQSGCPDGSAPLAGLTSDSHAATSTALRTRAGLVPALFMN
jgi:uncharacterized repeat protein (TIGR03803 family)